MQARAFRSVTRRQNLRARDREPHPSIESPTVIAEFPCPIFSTFAAVSSRSRTRSR